MCRKVCPATHPDIIAPGDMVKERHQAHNPTRMAQNTGVHTDRHHAWVQVCLGS
jgi:hypothetical protein